MTLFERMSRIGQRRPDEQQLIDTLKTASAAMPADQSLRFEAMLDQMSGKKPRQPPLPLPPE